ncbi:DUF4142 domain-containing protein [Streptomyces roseoverticillatus]|uniref:DUF4142 domain-containing protein n=1 Tax=Streptomyces roseoverticillatus TaxID=66429 RepID=UPI001F2459A9|nr:DUF4142 domain-containing protein [Streptomyces roseoverticillatus]MCF3101865.1 DUF4142 domain-containing protein [Streptomyces roseoverticillatus]
MRMGHRFTAAAAALVLATAPAGAALACDKGEETDKKTEYTAEQKTDKTEKKAEKKTGKPHGKKPGKQHGKRTGSRAETDGAFLRTAHQAGLAEIAMSRDAAKNAVMPCVRTAAETLVKDHAKMDKELKDLARRLKVTLPGKETTEQRRSLRDMRKKAHKREYDTLWLKAAEAGHAQALELLDDEIAKGKNADVREAARMARPVIAGHLAKVQVCQKER